MCAQHSWQRSAGASGDKRGDRNIDPEKKTSLVLQSNGVRCHESCALLNSSGDCASTPAFSRQFHFGLKRAWARLILKVINPGKLRRDSPDDTCRTFSPFSRKPPPNTPLSNFKMSFSLSKFTGKAEATAADNDVLKGKLGKVSYGATGTLEASLPEGLVGKLVFTDATLNSVRPRRALPLLRARADLIVENPICPQVKDKPTSLQPAGVSIEIAKPGAPRRCPSQPQLTARGAVPAP